MKKIRPHIQIGIHEGGDLALVIDDYELFDFIDDYLTDECAIEYESSISIKRVGGEIITMFFPKSVSAHELESALLRLSVDEIEKVYRLNNP